MLIKFGYMRKLLHSVISYILHMVSTFLALGLCLIWTLFSTLVTGEEACLPSSTAVSTKQWIFAIRRKVIIKTCLEQRENSSI